MRICLDPPGAVSAADRTTKHSPVHVASSKAHDQLFFVSSSLSLFGEFNFCSAKNSRSRLGDKVFADGYTHLKTLASFKKDCALGCLFVFSFLCSKFLHEGDILLLHCLLSARSCFSLFISCPHDLATLFFRVHCFSSTALFLPN